MGMIKIKIFFRTLLHSFTDPNYYGDVIKAKFNFSLKYFIVFYILLSSLFSIYTLVFVNNEVSPRIDGVVDEVVGMYPNDLIISFDGESSVLSTDGVEEPVVIPMIESEYIETDIESLLVIDTQANAEDISEYGSLLLLTDSYISTISDSSGGFQIFPLDELFAVINDNDSGRKITSVTLDKTFVDTNTPLVKVILHKFARMLPVIVFFGSIIFLIVSRLILLLILTVFNLIFVSLLGKKLRYSKMYQIGLHTITVAEGITKLSSLIFRDSVNSLFSFAFLGISFIALMGIDKKNT